MAINGKTIAKNTAVLYFRMILLMVVSLYTSRVVLAALGVDDFGIYNVVGGVVAVLGFLNGTLSTSSSRFVTVALAGGDEQNMRKTFAVVFTVNVMLLLIILLLAETVGLWFLYEKMTIPDARMNAAFWVYQFSVITVAFNITCVPFNASIIAHEKMSAFAYISLIDAFLKLGAAYCITTILADRLIFWGGALMAIQILNCLIYVFYCHKHFSECRLSLCFDRGMFKQIMGFISWSAYGSFVSVGFTQGLNIILNLFFNPAVNAARGIAVQIQGAVMQFTSNFQTAINPPLIKNTSQKDFESARKLLTVSSKFSFFLLCILGVPLIVEAHYVLQIWLGQVPDYAVQFVQIMLVIGIWGCLANPLRIVNQAEGNIKKFQLYECTILLMIVPVSYFMLKIWHIPILVFVVHLVIDNIAQVVRMKIVLPKIDMTMGTYVKNIYFRIIPVFFLSFIVPILINQFMEEGLIRFILSLVATETTMMLVIYVIGVTYSERQMLRTSIKKIVNRRKE